MSINFIAWHDRDTANHKNETDKAAAQGYRTVSLCVYGERNDPRYAAVMIKRPSVHAEQQFFALNGDQFQQKFNEMAAKGFGLYLVSATGPANNPLFAVSFRPMSSIPLTRHGITEQELAQQNREAWLNGLIPASIDAYGTPGNVRYIAVWHPNTARIPWNMEAISDATDLNTLQARFNAITAQGGRPAFMTMTPDNEFLELFTDDVTGNWGSRISLTAAQYQEQFNQITALGLAPISVTAQGTGANTRFSAVFVEREESAARVFTTSKSTAAVAGIDSAMEKFVKDHSVRGCALAITKGTRLVYAKGYTWAEQGYPLVEPTTLFRVASVSKVFVAAAIYRLIQQGVSTPDGKPFTLETTMQSVLKLKTPDGKEPVSPQFKNIKIRHLMESTSALDQGLIWRHVEAAQKAKANLPGTPAQLASLCASLPMQKDEKTGIEKTPGDTTNVVYGNADYFMLSQVIARLCGTATFEDALNQRILSPLGIKRVRGSRSLQAAQAADEARYHNTNIKPAPKLDDDGKPTGNFYDFPPSLLTYLSSQTNDRPLVPHQYGGDNYEVFDGCGGLSGAATDLARMMAALSVRQNNPLFSEATLDTWFQNTVAATAFTGLHKPFHGYHGFDWGKHWNPSQPISAPGNFATEKGGWLPTHSSIFRFTAGDLGFVVVINNGGQSDVKTDWYSDLDGDGKHDANSVYAVAAAQGDWKNIDLFPQFGMASFAANKSSGISKIDASNIPTLPKQFDGLNVRERDSITLQQARFVRENALAAPQK